MTHVTYWERLLQSHDHGGTQWMKQSACKNADPALFDGGDGGGDRSESRNQIGKFNNNFDPTAALKICEQCPVREPCLKWALADPYSEGVYGGVRLLPRWGNTSNRIAYKRQRQQLLESVR